MFTEREVLQQIVQGDPRGLQGLVERHGALLHEALLRFFGTADAARLPELERILSTMVTDLKADRFDDVVETFYDWVARSTFSTCMALRLEAAGGEHVEPDLLWEGSDRLGEAALPQEVRDRLRAHLAACATCRELQELCRDIPVEARHAGARIPDDFRAVLARVVACLAEDRGASQPGPRPTAGW
jgi:hypothetical protein